MAAQTDIFTLWDLRLRASAELVGFAASLSERYRGRLQEFGFHAGEEICCQQQPGFGAPRVFRDCAAMCLDRCDSCAGGSFLAFGDPDGGGLPLSCLDRRLADLPGYCLVSVKRYCARPIAGLIF